MDDIEQYQARIYAALDKVSRIIAESEDQDQQEEQFRARDASLIEKLEATLAEERANGVRERAEAEALKSRLAEADSDRQFAENARQAADAQREAADIARQSAEAKSETAEAAQKSAEARAEQAQSEARAPVAAPVSGSEAKIERLNSRLDSQDVQIKRLKAANAQLRDSIGVLRERNVDLQPDADAINQSMKAELEALKITRAADVDEMDTILEELKPLVEGQINA